MPRHPLVLLLVLLLVPRLALAVGSGVSRERLLIGSDDLATRLDDDDLVILHIGPEEKYAEEHIPGAIFVDGDDFTVDVPDGLQFQFPETDALVETFESLGIGDGSFVVVCFEGRWVTASTRLMLTLHRIGLGERSALLDGGMNAWRDAGHPVTTDVPSRSRAALTRKDLDGAFVDAAWVEAHLEDDAYQLVDARAAMHYEGIEATRLNREPVRKGHIPGAGNLPFTEIVDENLKLRPAVELRALFDAAGYDEGETIVAYCHLGLFATLVVHAARTLDLPFVFYDGSFQDWGSREDLPVVLETQEPTGE